MSEDGGPPAKRIKLSKEELETMAKEDLLARCNEQEEYIESLLLRLGDGEAVVAAEEPMGAGKDTDDKLKLQHMEAARRENILVMRLTNKEQEMQEYMNQLEEIKRANNPSSANLRAMLLDPSINLMFQRMKKEMESCKEKLEQAQNDLAAWKFTPDSQTGKRLMAKCRLLLQENEELGKVISSGRIAKLEGEIALQKKFAEEMKKSQAETDEFLVEMDEDVEGMQSTIYYLQQQLKEAKEQISRLQEQNTQLLRQQSGSTGGPAVGTNGGSPTPIIAQGAWSPKHRTQSPHSLTQPPLGATSPDSAQRPPDHDCSQAAGGVDQSPTHKRTASPTSSGVTHDIGDMCALVNSTHQDSGDRDRERMEADEDIEGEIKVSKNHRTSPKNQHVISSSTSPTPSSQLSTTNTHHHHYVPQQPQTTSDIVENTPNGDHVAMETDASEEQQDSTESSDEEALPEGSVDDELSRLQLTPTTTISESRAEDPSQNHAPRSAHRTSQSSEGGSCAYEGVTDEASSEAWTSPPHHTQTKAVVSGTHSDEETEICKHSMVSDQYRTTHRGSPLTLPCSKDPLQNGLLVMQPVDPQGEESTQ